MFGASCARRRSTCRGANPGARAPTRTTVNATGTTTLFAALNVASGEVVGRHHKRRRRVEFIGFMSRVIATYPEREIHVVLDNPSTHKLNRDMWLKCHENVHLHHTSIHSQTKPSCWARSLTFDCLNSSSSSARS
jgi:DDE superfamily endonuclease